MNLARRQHALDRIQTALGHRFRQLPLLTQALTHRSYAAQNNERFEFVGDAILNYTVAKMLFESFPKASEGELSRLRANLVNQEVLAEIARGLDVGDGLFLGSGELKSGGFDRASILADAVEAMFAAVSFDAGFAAAESVVRGLFADRVNKLNLNDQAKDPKTRLQEALQAQRLALPKYRIENQHGEGSSAVFEVSCDLGELGYISHARASSRRAAEQDCAKQALEWLEARLAATPKKRRHS